MKTIWKVVLPLLLLALGYAGYQMMVASPPKAAQRPQQQNLPTVEVIAVTPADYLLKLSAEGSVVAVDTIDLVAEVAGRVTAIGRGFEEGATLETGALLAQLDERDYRISLAQAEARRTQARQLLAEEQARAAQAERDWQRLGRGGKPDPLVLREPQLAAARAQVAEAAAEIESQQLALERTRITAPWPARVAERSIAVGSFVGGNGRIGQLYRANQAQVRLPLDAPTLNRLAGMPGQALTLRRSIDDGRRWQARWLRIDDEVDPQSRQAYLVIEVEAPFVGDAPLRIGEFVSAELPGQTLPQVVALPDSALRENRALYVVVDGVLERREVELLWRTGNQVVVRGLSAGDAVVVTAAFTGVSGTRVQTVPGEGGGA
ncbi:efflux RND transporter periplasmic adaptor subunit [Gammaproteobacteria bacterium]|nr:efflux RND transporter periplasmic adaptor subunit [Gammaproteobacteria bacterium]